ncbi:hypothetical protein [Streptomyces coffeae]|uniref:Uncharacterized protein n=1 Tax=Streptomyces coffeae TaxID=621382 RepID=A0ABS1NMT5_9ACTN|nr:hypothetical protein [Streptomyces coffeae]MBL1101402.1 hypothetical protein [Streptomyces coffeae]
MSANGRTATVPARGCALCTALGDFGHRDPADPRSGLCPTCIAAGKPTRDGLERSVVIVATQSLAAAEGLSLATAAPEELTYHLGAVRRSLRSVLQLLAPVEEGAGEPPQHGTRR